MLMMQLLGYILLGEIAAHNDNPKLKNDATEIMDWLLKNHHINLEEHKILNGYLNLT